MWQSLIHIDALSKGVGGCGPLMPCTPVCYGLLWHLQGAEEKPAQEVPPREVVVSGHEPRESLQPTASWDTLRHLETVTLSKVNLSIVKPGSCHILSYLVISCQSNFENILNVLARPGPSRFGPGPGWSLWGADSERFAACQGRLFLCWEDLGRCQWQSFATSYLLKFIGTVGFQWQTKDVQNKIQ